MMAIFWRQRMCKISSMTRNSKHYAVMQQINTRSQHTFCPRMISKVNENLDDFFPEFINWNILSFKRIEALSRRRWWITGEWNKFWQRWRFNEKSKSEETMPGNHQKKSKLISHAKLVPAKTASVGGGRAKNVVASLVAGFYRAKMKIKIRELSDGAIY